MSDKDFQTQLSGFLAAAQSKVDDYMKRNGFRGNPVIETEEGPKFIRVIRAEYNDPKNPTQALTRSAYCFIEKATGQVFKPAGWKAPERKNPRSNIFADDFGASGVDHHGAVYIRR
jgi:hypothetical protein